MSMNAKLSGGIIRALAMSSALLACSALQAADKPNWSPPRTADGKPVISGIWSNASMTNLSRPPGVTKLVVSRDEAAALVKANPFMRLIEADSGPSDLSDNLLDDKNADRGYNAFWVDPGNFLANVNGEYRTSWIVEPATGQVPLSDSGRQLLKAAREKREATLYYGPEALPLPERCLISFSGASGPGMLNPMYNNNYQIVQTPHYVTIRSEMYHNLRVIPLDGRARTNLPQWMGESRGRWEGDTLVVETSGFLDRSAYWWATGWRASRPTLHLVERFERVDTETLEYEFTMTDPAMFTRPWTARFPLTTDQAARGVTKGPLHEYACHEANYSLGNVLRGARMQDAAAAPTAGPR
jgi:hypothetical protein